MNLIKFLLLIVGVFLTIFALGYYENLTDDNSNVYKILKTVGSFGLLILFGYLIISKLDTGKINIFGYELEKGLVFYMSILFLVTFLL